ncbi:hypothetical protein B4U80_14485, partial [Leptotrombidium deliense]
MSLYKQMAKDKLRTLEVDPNKILTIIIGNYEYSESKANLPLVVNDLESLEKLFRERNHNVYSFANVTFEILDRILFKIAHSEQVPKSLIFYYTGHGDCVQAEVSHLIENKEVPSVVKKISV